MANIKIKNTNSVSSTEIQCSVPLKQSVKNKRFCLQVSDSSELSKTLREQIWAIFERNMKATYENARVFGWNPSEKREEMFHNLSRFLLVTHDLEVEDMTSNGKEALSAYCIFRFEREDKRNVIYLYELQTSENARRLGLGRAMVENLDSIGRTFKMSAIMLTHLTVNSGARSFYDSLDFKVDRTSPDYKEDEWIDEGDNNTDCGYSILSRRIDCV